MFNIPPIRDTTRNIRLRQLQEITAIHPVMPYPRSEALGHPGEPTGRPAAVDERLRHTQAQEPPPQGRTAGDDDEHQVDEFA